MLDAAPNPGWQEGQLQRVTTPVVGTHIRRVCSPLFKPTGRDMFTLASPGVKTRDSLGSTGSSPGRSPPTLNANLVPD